MSTSALAGRRFLLSIFVLAAVLAESAFVAAQEKNSRKLCFELPDSLVLHYKIFSQMNQNFSGMDVTFNQTAQVDVCKAGMDDEGNNKVEIAFKKITSSLVANNQLSQWEPPIKLEGKKIRAIVSRTGSVIKVEPIGNIPGVGKPDDLMDVVEPGFISFPDSSLGVGGTWTMDIVEEKEKGREPERLGKAVFQLKKIEKRGNLEVALIEGKITCKLNTDTDGGRLVGEEKSSLKALVAADAGYIVEIKRSSEIKGEVILKDELTGKEKRNEMVLSSTYEAKLE